ncbi:Ankyrin and het domain protein [Rutstroemia sp. NJR-2017a BBW]|nr:Ankyrin and het domain protein [Rutstroemia sp. NJR-2017a BBW]
MASIPPLPLRLLGRVKGEFKVFDKSEYAALKVDHFDILTHVWGKFCDPDYGEPDDCDMPTHVQGKTCKPYKCGIDGVHWGIKLSETKIDNIKRLIVEADIKYLWVDALCLNQEDEAEKKAEVLKMYEHYKSGRKCYALMEMHDVWDPQKIVIDLNSIDHILSYMTGTALAKEAGLGRNLIDYLEDWSKAKWVFPMDRTTTMSAAIDLGVLNCYATCIGRVKSLFDNVWFTRVWTFQEMLLGKNITIYGMNQDNIACVGELATWMNLATDCFDKATKLRVWIDRSRVMKNAVVSTVLRIIYEDLWDLWFLSVQARGINTAKSDILNGGPFWWRENYKGVANVFSAISIIPRNCGQKHDIFRGLLGIFNGLFTTEEVDAQLDGDDIERMSFAFFKQLSLKTGYAVSKLSIHILNPLHPQLNRPSTLLSISTDLGDRFANSPKWTRLAVSREKRERHPKSKITTSDCYAAVFNMGLLDLKKGLARADAMTDIIGEPRKYMKIELCERAPGDNKFRFEFKGCNCGKKVKTGFFSKKRLPSYDQPKIVVGDETGRALVQCATILGSLIDPGNESEDLVDPRHESRDLLDPGYESIDLLDPRDESRDLIDPRHELKHIVRYRKRLLKKLKPSWEVTDPLAKPLGWEDKCVSGTYWEDLVDFRVHNRSLNYIMESVSCGTRLENESTSNILCKLEVNCGCKIIGSFPLVFQALTAVEGSSLGETSVEIDKHGRIMWQDGLGLVQVGDVGKIFHLVAYSGDINAHKSYASRCRSTDLHKRIKVEPIWPKSRAMVGEEFTNSGLGHFMKNYGYVNTGGSGNLLISRNQPLDKYKVIGVCIDQNMEVKKGSTEGKYVTIQ